MDNIKTGQNGLQSRATFLPRPNCDKKTGRGVIWVEKR